MMVLFVAAHESAVVQVFGRRSDGFSTHSDGRRPKSAKARNRGMWAAAVPRVLWGFGHELGCACDERSGSETRFAT